MEDILQSKIYYFSIFNFIVPWPVIIKFVPFSAVFPIKGTVMRALRRKKFPMCSNT